MYKLLFNIDSIKNSLDFSTSIKVASSNYIDLTFDVYGQNKNLSLLKNYSKNIGILNSDENDLTDISNSYDAIITNENNSNYSFDNYSLVFKVNKLKFIVFVQKSDDFTNFKCFIDRFDKKFKYLSNENENLINSIKEDSHFDGLIKLNDFLINPSEVILTKEEYFINFLNSLKAISNFFSNQNKKKESDSSFSKMSKLLFAPTKERKEKTMYSDFIFDFRISFNNNKIYLLLNDETDVNDMLKGINITSQFVKNIFDLQTKWSLYNFKNT